MITTTIEDPIEDARRRIRPAAGVRAKRSRFEQHTNPAAPRGAARGRGIRPRRARRRPQASSRRGSNS